MILCILELLLFGALVGIATSDDEKKEEKQQPKKPQLPTTLPPDLGNIVDTMWQTGKRRFSGTERTTYYSSGYQIEDEKIRNIWLKKE